MELAASPLASIAVILTAMTALAAAEAALPLRARSRWSRAHLAPNLALTFLTFATNAALGAGLVLLLDGLAARGLGLLNAFPLAAPLHVAVVLLGLDFAFYVAHVAMHRSPALWRFHRVHHSDPAVDVTTTVRQHPGEGLIRYAFTSAFACALGASPAAFAVYRLAVALVGLLEHANVRLPQRLDTALSLVFTWPNTHKIHHARDARLTDTNYGNLVSWWDRLFGTFTPSRRGADVAYGLDGLDDPASQTTRGLLALPWRVAQSSSGGSLDSASSGMPSPDSRDRSPVFE
jgi:sterol desaturase/sphingolipid hydroxylase (fatty acid hydroxylase superfamily)